MKEIDNFLKKLNQTQKLIIGIAFPLLIIIILLPIAEEASWNAPHGGRYAGSDPFRSNTWYIWLFAVILIGFVEFKLFSDQEGK